jgi:WD40 repeat protein/serine/threonine protein kinase
MFEHMDQKAPASAADAQREAALFAAALERPPAERAAFLDGACHGDPALRARLEALLAAHEHPAALLDAPGDAPRPEPGLRFTDEPAEDAVGQTIGRYKLLEKIGEGGCGVVYVAEQTAPVRRRVALKVIKLGMDTKAVVARFEAERQALAMMDHPNIAKVLDAGTTETGRPYFVMELVRGIKITDYCDQANLSTKERLDLFIKVCQAIQHAHQKGIIHRDIKPSNILVTLHDGVPVPKVIDFGIAKATEGRLTDATVYTQLHQFIGTPAYMSPEQAEMSGLDVDTRSDIYSLGVLLYELLTGSTPFDPKELLSQGLDAMRKTIREKEPVRPSTRLATLGADQLTTTAKRRSAEAPKLIHQLKGDLDWIVMKCLEKDRARRYETANGLAADLKRFLNNEPVVARPPSTAYRLQKAFRRNKVVFTAAAAVVMALVLGLGTSLWQTSVATRERNAAEEARRAEARERAAAVAERNKAIEARKLAEEARQRADEERARAEASEQMAQRSLYTANLNLAQQAWEQNNVGRVRQLLQETANYPDRGFEWYFWQRQTHLELKTLRGHIDSVTSVAFSPDGQWILTGSGDGTAKVWDASTGQERLTLKGHSAGILSVAFSPDGRRILTGSGDLTAKVWDALTGEERLTLKGHSDTVTSVALSPDGQWILTGSGDQTARVWDAASGQERLTLKGHGAWIYSAVFSPDGRRILTGSLDQTAKVWDASSGRERLTLKGHNDAVTSAAFSPDGQRILTGSFDQTAKVWDASTGEELLTLKGHTARIWSVAFSPDGQRILTGSFDQTAKVWDASTGEELLTLKGHTARIWSVAFSPDGRRILTGSFDQTAKVWDASTGQGRLTFKGHSAWIWSVAFSPDSRRILTGSGDQTAKVWDASSGQERLTLEGHGAGIFSVTFSPDGRRFLTGSRDQTAKVWDAATGQERLTLRGHTAMVRAVAFSPDGRRILTGSADRTARVWDASSGQDHLTLKGHSAEIWSVAFSPDGRRILTGSLDQAAKVWDASTGEERLTLKGHSAWIYSAVFSPDGQRILTGSADGTTKVWDASSGQERLTLKGHSAWITSVAFSADGQRILTGSADQTAMVWEVATPEQVAAWEREERAAMERLAVLRQERAAAIEHERALRAQDAGAIKRWLVLAHIRFDGNTGATALDQEQVPHEADLRPAAGQRIRMGDTERIWTAVEQEDYVLDFNRFVGAQTSWSVAYAVCYVRLTADQTGLVMKVGSDDQAKVYLDGKEAYRQAVARSYRPDQDAMAGLDLKAGLHVVVFKVVNETGGWQGSIRFTDRDGQPVPGLRVTLDPGDEPLATP